MTKLKPEAIALLRAVQDKIRESPTSFDIRVVRGKIDRRTGAIRATIPLRGEELVPPCGTVACIAGWVDIFTSKRPAPSERQTMARAAKILGLSRERLDNWDESDHMKLFCSDLWPEPFRSQDAHLEDQLLWGTFVGNKGKIKGIIKKRGQVAIRRINHLIKHGE